MANFKTHKNFSLIISIVLALFFYFTGVIYFSEIFYLVIIGTIAWLLPDLDHSESLPNFLLFNIIGTIVVSMIFLIFYDHYDWFTVFLIMLVTYLFILYWVRYIYNKIVVHRWMFHSIPTAVLLSIILFHLSHNIIWIWFNRSLIMSIFLFVWYMTHLILDEMYSVDLYNAKLKRSFWTALKFYSRKYIVSSIIVYSLLLISFLSFPNISKIYPWLIDLFSGIF